MKVTATDIREALKARYPQGEYAVLFEVLDATGARQTRSADAVVMSCWPSRGLELHGMEIKVSRSDWQHERKQPAKAETIAAYCDRWWLVTGPGVVHDIGEIPPAWGWMEFVPAGEDLAGSKRKARLVTRKEPTKTAAKVCDRMFLASLLRNASRVADGIQERIRRELREEVEASVQDRIDTAVKRRTERAANLVSVVEGFEAATGIKLTEASSWSYLTEGDGRDIGNMVTAIRASRLNEHWGGLAGLHKALTDVVGTLEVHAASLGIPVKPPAKKRRAA